MPTKLEGRELDKAVAEAMGFEVRIFDHICHVRRCSDWYVFRTHADPALLKEMLVWLQLQVPTVVLFKDACGHHVLGCCDESDDDLQIAVARAVAAAGERR